MMFERGMDFLQPYMLHDRHEITLDVGYTVLEFYYKDRTNNINSDSHSKVLRLFDTTTYQYAVLTPIKRVIRR